MEFNKIAILGAGQGGLASAADMVLLAGCEVNIFELPQFGKNLDPLKEAGGVYVERNGKKQFAKLNIITTDIVEAIEGVDLIMPVVPTFAHKPMAELLAPLIKGGENIILNPGSTGGALEFLKVFRDMGVDKEFNLAETNTLPYGVRKSEPATVRVLLDSKGLVFSAIPTSKTDEMLKAFKKLYPSTIKAKNVLEVGLNNGNPISHPTAAILNTGRIEYTNGDYYHYKEGITPSIARTMEKLDKERLAICDALGIVGVPTAQRLVNLGYTEAADTLYEQYTTSKVFAPMRAPENMNGRFITEDIPYGLVTWASIAELINVDVPLMKSLVHVASAIMGKEYFEEGRTMKNLGLEKLSIEEFKKFVEEGKF
jgi:opine dehydrogenase